MYEIKKINENETRDITMNFIDNHRNWNVEKQEYRFPEKEDCKANLSDCEIYWRGEYLILQHENIVHYWDSFPYCFLIQAVELMELDKPKKWKTLDKLISFRCAIRQTEVNHCGFVNDIFEGNNMTRKRFDSFMQLARSQDLWHHGSHTF